MRLIIAVPLLLLLPLPFADLAVAQPVTPRLVARNGIDLIAGDGSGITVDGLRAGDEVTVHASRRYIITRRVDGNPATDTLLFRSTGVFRANRRGIVLVDSAAPESGTWRAADPHGLFWSMERVTAPSPSPPARGMVQVVLEMNGTAVDSLWLRMRASLSPLVERTVADGAIAGAYAAPNDSMPHPVVLLLHGSEGGDTASAQILARRFAARGYAAFALVYVSYGGALPGIPTTFDAVPLELLDRAREWMGRQREADTSRTAIWGVSKGAELALVAAAFRTWPRAVVACVPSDVVWAGFGRPVAAGEELSSWSVGGKPLPAVQYDRYEDVFSGKSTARAVHDRSRVKYSSTVGAARIPIERTGAPLLLLGAERDEVWASSEMAQWIGATLAARGKSKLASVAQYSGAGHGICGDGSTPWDLYGPGTADKRSTARSSADAWRRTVAFLTRELGRSHRDR